MKQEETKVSEEKPAIDVDALLKRVEQLESSNSRLLDESKGWKEKFHSEKSKSEVENERKLAENEQWKELNEVKDNKIFDLESKVKDLTTLSMQKELQYKIASKAKDAHNIDDVVTAVSKTGLLNLDKDTGTITGIDEAYNLVRSEKHYLFDTTKKSGMSAGKPDTMIPKEKSLEELIDENPQDILANVLKDFVK